MLECSLNGLFWFRMAQARPKSWPFSPKMLALLAPCPDFMGGGMPPPFLHPCSADYTAKNPRCFKPKSKQLDDILARLPILQEGETPEC